MYSETLRSVSIWAGSTNVVAPLSPTPMQRPCPLPGIPGKEGPQKGRRRFLNPFLVSQGENVFFIVTNLIVTPNQRQGTCAEV